MIWSQLAIGFGVLTAMIVVAVIAVIAVSRRR
jgi:hypothetical protein